MTYSFEEWVTDFFSRDKGGCKLLPNIGIFYNEQKKAKWR